MEPLHFPDIARALLENSLREAERGRCRVIALELADDALRVADDGGGLPLDTHPRSGRSLLEVILTGPRRGPRNTLARVNAHCLWVEIQVHRRGELWFQRYELARPLGPPARRGSATRRSGTTVSCAPALGVAPRFEELRAMVRELASERETLPVKLRLRDLRERRDETIAFREP